MNRGHATAEQRLAAALMRLRETATQVSRLPTDPRRLDEDDFTVLRDVKRAIDIVLAELDALSDSYR